MGVRATTYLQIEPEWSYNGQDVWGAKVIRSTQRDPKENQKGGTVLVKITVDLPAAAFKPLQPEAVVVVPEHLTLVKPIEVEADDPRPDEPDDD